MDTPIKTYIFLYLMQFLIIFGISNVHSQMQVSQAQNYAEDAVRQIENSDYNVNVINSVITQARNSGYGMTVVVYLPDNTSKEHDVLSTTADQIKDAVMARVDISYQNTNPFTGYQSIKQVRRFSQ